MSVDSAELRMALGVEELRRLQVCGEVLVLDDDRADVDNADELAVDERRVELLEAPAEGRDDHVLDGERGARVDGSRTYVPVICSVAVAIGSPLEGLIGLWSAYAATL
jgi:hypothetical protein